MYRGKQHVMYGVSLLGLLTVSFTLQATEVLTVEQAMVKCKNTYPSEFEAKKRLACFDSISTVAIETEKKALTNGIDLKSHTNDDVLKGELEMEMQVVNLLLQSKSLMPT